MSKPTVPPAVQRLLYVFYGLAACLVVADVLIHRHVSHPAESWFAFYPLFGFVACVVLVFAATAMRHVVMRPQNYYDEQADVDERADAEKMLDEGPLDSGSFSSHDEDRS
ncbi:MAG: hypothetical protein AAF525_15885 [Pseudomonadota bacterium]